MKKTTLLLLSCAGVLAGCYTSPEMNEGRYENLYIEDESACRYNDGIYQHKGLRRCLENRMAYEDANKKTVKILQQKDGTALVIPKTYDDALMSEQNRVYEVVERDTNTIFTNENAKASEEDFARLVEKPVVEEELADAVLPEPALVVDESDVVIPEPALVVDESDVVYETPPDENVVETEHSVQETDASVPVVQETDASMPVVQIVVEAENPAPPQVVPVVEQVVQTEEEVEEDKECCDECCENEEDTSDEKDMTFVMQPSDDEVIISIKSKKKSGETCTCKQKKSKKTEVFKKNEKEYLPLEEK
ncbi:MAG: hypothetical protein ACI4RJ_01980 [Alphaproteobacteria bacterium]